MLPFDLANLGPEFHQDPYPVYRLLRERDPVHRCPDGTWFLTRYESLNRIYRDRSSFSSDKKTVFAPKFGERTPLYEHHTNSLVFNDPPYHTRVRRAIVGALTSRVLEDMKPGLIELVDRLLARIEAQGEFDGIEDFAAAIPVEVIGNLLSVPQSERGPLRAWSMAILGALEPVLSTEQQQRGNVAVAEFLAYLRTLIARQRRAPADDGMLARLLREERTAAPISETELLHNCIFLLNAGHETTTNLIGNALHLLLTHDEQLRRLRADPALIATAVEEFLRLKAPISSATDSWSSRWISPAPCCRRARICICASVLQIATRRSFPSRIGSMSDVRPIRIWRSPLAAMRVPECPSPVWNAASPCNASSSVSRTCASRARQSATRARASVGFHACGSLRTEVPSLDPPGSQ